eukprot:jgi/Chrzof1/4638/Cz14g21010.t1
MSVLPSNYNFEIHKTVWRIRQAGATQVALQFPEGLLMYACAIADILEEFAGVEHCFVMGDVTYGACCVDDYSAVALGAQLLVHYGHSCLVPVDVTNIPCLYVFVDIQIDLDHMVETIKLNFQRGTDLVLAGTIQFSTAIQMTKQQLARDYPSLAVPKCRPLSPGEVLGCTAPVLTTHADAIVFVADGRFHLEAIMIANPTVPAYRYDPYSRQLIIEKYDQKGMRAARRKAIECARHAHRWGVVLGTLGRQGNPHIVNLLQQKLQQKGLHFTTILLSEVSPVKLALIGHIDAWVQVACPRLSIDWGEGFTKPTLTPYEALIALGEVSGWWETSGEHPSDQQPGTSTLGATDSNGEAVTAGGWNNQQTASRSDSLEGYGAYPMDYYAKDGGIWNSSYHKKPGLAEAQAP